MSDGHRPKLEWMIKIRGAELARLEPGQTLEIGRKPLRPLPDDGRQRLDVVDGTKSMSKRHALVTFHHDGSTTIRDMGSTNGSYIVQDDGRLARIPIDSPYLIPGPSVRFQFGDVPVDFVQVKASDEGGADPARQVPNLFSYARGGEKSVEPDAADMSVDDILDMRAGEPTGIFKASGTRTRVKALHDMALGGSEPEGEQTTPIQVGAQSGQSTATPSSPDESLPGGQEQTRPLDPSQVQTQDPRQAPSRQDEELKGQKPQEVQAGGLSPQEERREGQTPLQRNLFMDAMNTQTGQGQTTPPSDIAGTAQNQPTPQTISPEDHFQPLGAVELAQMRDQERRSRGQEQNVINQPQEEETYRPAFEPGSIFERVSQGGYGSQERIIEVDGMSSEDAKRTSDFALQFEMAKHPQLLPFLAMNPALYDDLYAWLSAQGNEDIDAALQNNDGYREYLNATGK